MRKIILAIAGARAVIGAPAIAVGGTALAASSVAGVHAAAVHAAAPAAAARRINCPGSGSHTVCLSSDDFFNSTVGYYDTSQAGTCANGKMPNTQVCSTTIAGVHAGAVENDSGGDLWLVDRSQTPDRYICVKPGVARVTDHADGFMEWITGHTQCTETHPGNL